MVAATPDLTARIRDALRTNPARIQRLDHDGRSVWVKRKERLGLLRRLQKGDAAAAFETERRALHTLAARGVPVAPLLDEGADYIALGDSGIALDRLLLEQTGELPERLRAFEAAAVALAQLHGNRISHGRPALKDICWDGSRITLLDFERYAPHRNTPRGHAIDLVIFVLSGFTVGRGPSKEMQRAIAAYRAKDPNDIWGRAQHLCARLGWIDWATKPLQWRGAGKAREFKAIPLTLATFARP